MRLTAFFLRSLLFFNVIYSIEFCMQRRPNGKKDGHKNTYYKMKQQHKIYTEPKKYKKIKKKTFFSEFFQPMKLISYCYLKRWMICARKIHIIYEPITLREKKGDNNMPFFVIYDLFTSYFMCSLCCCSLTLSLSSAFA